MPVRWLPLAAVMGALRVVCVFGGCDRARALVRSEEVGFALAGDGSGKPEADVVWRHLDGCQPAIGACDCRGLRIPCSSDGGALCACAAASTWTWFLVLCFLGPCLVLGNFVKFFIFFVTLNF